MAFYSPPEDDLILSAYSNDPPAWTLNPPNELFPEPTAPVQAFTESLEGTVVDIFVTVISGGETSSSRFSA